MTLLTRVWLLRLLQLPKHSLAESNCFNVPLDALILCFGWDVLWHLVDAIDVFLTFGFL